MLACNKRWVDIVVKSIGQQVKETGKVVISNSFMELTPAAQIAKL